MLQIFIPYLLLGAAAGLLAGLLGVGGGLVIVPILSWLLLANGVDERVTMQLALGTSLATIIFTSLSSIRAHHRRGAVNWALVRGISPGIVVGTLMGAGVAGLLPGGQLRTIFGLFELLVGVQMLMGLRPASHRVLPNRWINGVVGGVIGLVSAVVGIGGGTMSVPYLLFCNRPLREAIGSSAAIGLPIAIAGMVGYLLMGLGVEGRPVGSVGYLYLPALMGIMVTSVITAPVGAYLAHTLPVVVLKRLFSFGLLVMGSKMLVG